jgi:hypothetical protein
MDGNYSIIIPSPSSFIQLYIQYLDIDMFVCMTGPFTHVTTSINSYSGGTKLNETKIPTNLSLNQLYTFILKGREMLREVEGEEKDRLMRVRLGQ